jgi:hypothetical protein
MCQTQIKPEHDMNAARRWKHAARRSIALRSAATCWASLVSSYSMQPTSRTWLPRVPLAGPANIQVKMPVRMLGPRLPIHSLSTRVPPSSFSALGLAGLMMLSLQPMRSTVCISLAAASRALKKMTEKKTKNAQGSSPASARRLALCSSCPTHACARPQGSSGGCPGRYSDSRERESWRSEEKSTLSTGQPGPAQPSPVSESRGS